MQSAIRLFRDISSDSSSGDSSGSTLSDILGAIPGALTGTAAIIAATKGNPNYRLGSGPYLAAPTATPSYLIWIIVAVVLLVVVMLIARK